MRKKIVAANWKMNMNSATGEKLVNGILNGLPKLQTEHHVVICPPYPYLAMVQNLTKNETNLHTGAQNAHAQESGAFTGEVAAGMLKEMGVDYVILGHSERREYCNETNVELKDKVDRALADGLQIIFCCGESLAIRDNNTQNDFVEKQLVTSLFHLEASQYAQISIAYEPIWAIGTGRTATAQQAQEIHAHIRQVFSNKYGTEMADNLTILYGGSCKASNANELFSNPDVDGGLIGGASLKAVDFVPIVEAMVQTK